MTADYEWEPLSIAELHAVMEQLGMRWWVAGGWAIDLFLGRQTRTHGDIDAAVLREEHSLLTRLQPEWDVHIAHDGTLMPWSGEPLTPEQHQFWVRRPKSAAWSFELLIEESGGNNWVYRRNARVRLPLDRFGAVTADGTPYIRPEIALLYKAKPPAHENDRNAADFEAALPALTAAARAWLREALELTFPHHPWLERL